MAVVLNDLGLWTTLDIPTQIFWILFVLIEHTIWYAELYFLWILSTIISITLNKFFFREVQVLLQQDHPSFCNRILKVFSFNKDRSRTNFIILTKSIRTFLSTYGVFQSEVAIFTSIDCQFWKNIFCKNSRTCTNLFRKIMRYSFLIIYLRQSKTNYSSVSTVNY